MADPQNLPVAPPAEPSFSSLAGLPGAETPAAADPSGATQDIHAPAGSDEGTIELAAIHVPGYEILHEVGRGGMGVVYKARQTSLNRPVALKMILAGAHAGPAERERFRREAEAVAALQHPHIVQIFEVGEADGHPYLALEYVAGGSLAQHLLGRPWHARASAELIDLLARAVHYAHTQGVVHRDLKPGNVLLSIAECGVRNAESGSEQPVGSGFQSAFRIPHSAFPKLTDFGLAKRLDSAPGDDGTKTGAVMGTPSYIAPEQAAGKSRQVGPGADIYALGAILYECLTGRPPFRGESPLDTVLQVLKDDPVPPRQLQPTVPRDLETICLKCLAKTPEKRYATALALGDDLRRFLNGEPIHARPVSAWGRGVKWARRHPALAVFGAVTVAATVALVGVLSVSYARVRDAVEQKELEAEAARTAKEQERAARRRAEALAAENETARRAAVAQSEQLAREAERTKRAAYALQLAQIAAMAERGPRRALALLDDPVRCPPELRDFTWAYLRRLCQREDLVYGDHPKADALHAVAVAPGGTFVATAGRDGRVRVWDPRTGRTWAVLDGHRGTVLSLAFSPDGGVLAAAGVDHRIHLWEFPADMLELARRATNAFTFLQPLVKPAVLAPAVALADGLGSEVNGVAFTPDGRTLAAALGDGRVKFWNLGGWRANGCDAAALGGPVAVGLMLGRGRTRSRPVWHEHEFYAHNGPARCLAFNDAGTLLATGGDDKTARVWPTDPAAQVRVIDRHAEAVLAVAFAPDGRTLATANNGPTPTIRLIDAETWRDTRRLIGHTAKVHGLAFSPDGALLASAAADRSVRLWDVEDGRERVVLLGHEAGVRGVAFGADRRAVVSAGADGTARVWQTGARANESADLTRDGQLAAAAVGGAGTPFVVGDEAGRVQVLLTDVTFGGRGPAAAPGGAFLFWRVPVEFEPHGPVRAVVAAPDGGAVVVAAGDALYLWRIFQFRSRAALPGSTLPIAVARPLRVPTPKPVAAMAADPSDRFLATLDADGVRVWDLRQLLLSHGGEAFAAPPVLPGTADAHAVAFHPKGDRLAVASGTGLRVIDLAGKALADLPTAHPARIEALAFDPAGGALATGDAGGLVKVWRVEEHGELTAQAELEGHTDAVTTLCFNPTGRTLASGGADRSVILWDPLAGQERAVLTGHADRLLRVQFTTDGHALLSVGRDGAVKRWRAEPRDAAKPLPKLAARKW